MACHQQGMGTPAGSLSMFCIDNGGNNPAAIRFCSINNPITLSHGHVYYRDLFIQQDLCVSRAREIGVAFALKGLSVSCRILRTASLVCLAINTSVDSKATSVAYCSHHFWGADQLIQTAELMFDTE